MRLACLSVLSLFILTAQPLLAQPANDDCSTAATLCADQPVAGNNTGANVWPGFCTTPATDNVVWYTFTTNSQGGTVDVSVNDINCPPQAGMDNELSAVVFSGDGNCTPNAFVSVGDCQHDSLDFDIITNPLLPNTQYWVVVAGVIDNGATIAAQCDFNINTSGPGADIVGVDFSAGPDVTLTQGGSTQLQATGGGPDYDWSPLAGLSGNHISAPFATPEESTLYSVATQLNGCVYVDQVFVEVNRPISPPNTITPNGDDINDVWEIFGIQDYPQATVSIYDRWGQRVFNSVGYKTPFDGGGLPTATYYWVIQLSQLEGVSEPYTGFLTIVN
jgi:gliding motility-associated-like protein